MRRFPEELVNLLESAVLCNHRSLLDNKKSLKLKVSWSTLKDEILQFLRDHGVTKEEYPFNTADEGYGSICLLANSLLYGRPNQFIRTRYGEDAGRHLGIGFGASSLIRASEPFQILEADFHKHDSAATVEIETPTRGSIFAPVPRFWIGAIVDTFNKAILGSTDSYEKQTTVSCVLDLIDSSIEPPDPDPNITYARVSRDGCWLPNQIHPQFAFHGWDILRLDRAWAHYSYHTISSIVTTIGCAICFSRPRSWWSRSIVERTFLDLTNRGALQLDTTTGRNPQDPKRDHPEATAINLEFTRIKLCQLSRTVIRELNESSKQGAFWEAPLNSLKRTGDRPNYWPRPIPKSRRIDRPTLWMFIEKKVEGNVNYGINPSVRTHQCRFQGDNLANSWSLVGHKVWLVISRRDINNAKIVNRNNGQLIDKVKPENQWREFKVPWSIFCLIQKFGSRQAKKNRPPSSINDFKNYMNKSAKVIKNEKLLKESNSATDLVNSIKPHENDSNNDNNPIEDDTNCTSHKFEKKVKLLASLFGVPPEID